LRSSAYILGVALLGVACAPARRAPVITYPAALSHREDPLEGEGEIAAAAAVGVDRGGALGGGDARAGLYWLRRRAVPMLVGNRIGFDFRLRALYGHDGAGAPSGSLLLGAAPAFSQQFGELGRRGTGVRVPSLLGLALPETGLWLRSATAARFYLGWRAPIAWLLVPEAGLEVAPSFAWAPVRDAGNPSASAWLATFSAGGFIR
jgi:hypothetical protein